MPKLKTLSGNDIVSILSGFGFHLIDQTGSHTKLRRYVDGQRQTLTVPLHKEIDKGLLKAIFIQASAYIPEKELKEYFYTE